MILYLEPEPERAHGLVAAIGSGVRFAPDLAELPALVAADPSAQVVLLGRAVALSDAVAFASRMRVHRPCLGVVLMRDRLDVSTLGEALRAGVREVVAADDTDGIVGALARSLELSSQLGGAIAVAAAPVAPAAGAEPGKLVTVFAGKGGCGKSTVATNLAIALASGGTRRVLLLDLDLSCGDVAVMLQLVPVRSMVDAVPMAGRLDDTGLRSLLTPFAPGVDVLLAPAGQTEGEGIGRDLVAEIITVARLAFDFIVVDTPPFFSDPVLAALDVTDRYVLIATPDIPSLKNLRLTLGMFDLLEYPKEQRIVVLNRADSRVGLTPADLERVIRAPIQGTVPSSRDVVVSINRGVPLMVEDVNHPVSRAIRHLAAVRLGGRDGDFTARAKRRPFLLRRGR